MSRVISGTYRAGKIELDELPVDIAEDTSVVVTFAEPSMIDLGALGVSEAQAAEARASLATIAADWESPEMSVYDDYDAAPPPTSPLVAAMPCWYFFRTPICAPRNRGPRWWSRQTRLELVCAKRSS